MTVRDTEYIESAKSINCGTFRIIMKHIIPNAIGPMIVQITMGIGSCILAGAALSFIGLGVQPPIPEWGTMISEARNVMRQHPHTRYIPAYAL
jgi:peptide/nickel transport system permease protein